MKKQVRPVNIYLKYTEQNTVVDRSCANTGPREDETAMPAHQLKLDQLLLGTDTENVTNVEYCECDGAVTDEDGNRGEVSASIPQFWAGDTDILQEDQVSDAFQSNISTISPEELNQLLALIIPAEPSSA